MPTHKYRDGRQTTEERLELIRSYTRRVEVLGREEFLLQAIKGSECAVLGHCHDHAAELSGRAGGARAVSWYALEHLRTVETPLLVPVSTVAEIATDCLREFERLREEIHLLKNPRKRGKKRVFTS